MKLNRQGFLVGDTHRQCTRCGEFYEITNAMTICKACNTSRVKSNSPEYKMLARAKMRAAKHGLPFNIDLSDIVIPEKCPVLGIDIYVNSGKPGAFMNSPSLDKIIPELGYVKGNVQVMSQLANQMKGAATSEQLIKFSEWIQKTYAGEE